MRKFGKYAVAFFVAFLAFILSGFFSLGNFLSTGSAMNYYANEAVIFSFQSAVELDAVYVNVGAIYAATGETASIQIETSTYTSPNSTNGKDFGEKATLSATYAEARLTARGTTLSKCNRVRRKRV